MTSPGFAKHNHAHCVRSALSAAERCCAEQKLQLTPVRRRVLEHLLSDHKALGAYDLLPLLAAEGLGSQPPVVYRALDFLVRHGFAHRIEKLNAYTACARPGAPHTPAFMICRSCTAVVETEAPAALAPAAKTAGFAIETTVIEAEGLCPDCQDAPAS